MITKTVVWHEPSDRFAILDHPSQLGDFVHQILGLPTDLPMQVIPKEFHVYNDVPHHSIGEPS